MPTELYWKKQQIIMEPHFLHHGDYGLVKTLINAGVNINITERCGATPLTIAVFKGR